MVDLRLEPRQGASCIVPYGPFMHHARHAALVHPVLLDTDALQLPVRFDVIAVEQGSGIFRPQVPATQGEIGGRFAGSGLLHDLRDAIIVHGDHAEGRGFLGRDAHQTGHRPSRLLVGLHQVA